MTYAVNLCDVSDLSESIAAKILLPKLRLSGLVQIAKGMLDGDAVMCQNTDGQQVDAILRTLKATAKRERLPFRVYQQGARGGWKPANLA